MKYFIEDRIAEDPKAFGAGVEVFELLFLFLLGSDVGGGGDGGEGGGGCSLECISWDHHLVHETITRSLCGQEGLGSLFGACLGMGMGIGTGLGQGQGQGRVEGWVANTGPSRGIANGSG